MHSIDHIRREQRGDFEGTEATKSTRPEQNMPLEEVIYQLTGEEQWAAACVSWNPNAQAGQQAAASIANGLLRVEDLAV